MQMLPARVTATGRGLQGPRCRLGCDLRRSHKNPGPWLERGKKNQPISSEVLCARTPLPRAQTCTKGLRKEGDLLIPSAGQKINEK